MYIYIYIHMHIYIYTNTYIYMHICLYNAYIMYVRRAKTPSGVLDPVQRVVLSARDSHGRFQILFTASIGRPNPPA